MARVVLIDQPDVVALIERAAKQMTGGDKTELVAMAVRRLFRETGRQRSLFGSHPGSVRIGKGVDLTKPILEDPMDAEIGDEIHR